MYGPEGYMTKKDEQDQENWQAEFDREGEWHDEATTGEKATTTYEGGGMLDGQKVPTALAGVTGLTTTDTSLFDKNGALYEASAVSDIKTNEAGKVTGNITWEIGDNKVTLPAGTNPYTRTENLDCEYGTFENGYQPNNVASYYDDESRGRLTETDDYDYINGVQAPIYVDAVGKPWIWDAANNEYMEYGEYTPSIAPKGGAVGSKVPTLYKN